MKGLSGVLNGLFAAKGLDRSLTDTYEEVGRCIFDVFCKQADWNTTGK